MEQVRAICSLPEFRSGTSLNATVVVFAWRRLASLRRLTQSLERAEYCGTEVPLFVLADKGASEEVLTYVSELRWSHGAKRLYLHEGPALGIRGMWVHMFRQAEGRNLLPFEDDIEASPLYFWWLTRMVWQFGPLETAEQVRAKSLAGISLYTPRLNEIQYPQQHWVASRYTSSPAFLLQVPCSWGALFFSAYFEDFLAFYDARTAPPFYNFTEEKHQSGQRADRQKLGDWRLRLPNARCNVWPRSWKRFLIDFMFARGLVMLYPSFEKQRCFSTTYMERGDHSGIDGKHEAVTMGTLRKDLDPHKTPPLLPASHLSHVQRRLDTELPSQYDSLPVFSLHHHQSDRLQLAAVGASFLARVWRRGAQTQQAALYKRLVGLWGGPEAALPPLDMLGQRAEDQEELSTICNQKRAGFASC